VAIAAGPPVVSPARRSKKPREAARFFVALRVLLRAGMFLGSSNHFSPVLRVSVDPTAERQLDPSGVALFWRRGKARLGGILATFDVCDAPGCPARDLRVWAIPVEGDLIAVALDSQGRLALETVPRFDGRPAQRAPELYALIDVDRWTLQSQPGHSPNARARRLLAELRTEMDQELRTYLRGLFDASRQHRDERHLEA
jgi:hypothetical protein